MWRRHGSAPTGLRDLISDTLRSRSVPDDQPASPGLDPISRYEALLRVSRAIARHTSVAELLRAISDQLHLVVPFDYLMLVLHDAQMDEMRLVVLEPANTPFAPFVSMPLSDWGPARSVWETQRTLVVPLRTEPLLGTPLEFLRDHGAQATCWLPLTTAHRQVGVLTFGSRHADQYAADAVAFMEQVSAHVAIAVDNAINFDDAQRLQGELRAERDRLRLVLDMNNLLVSRLDYPGLLEALSDSLARVVKHDVASLALFDRESNNLRLQVLTYTDARGVLEPNTPLSLEGSPAGIAFQAGAATVFRKASLDKLAVRDAPNVLSAGAQSLCCVPLVTQRGSLGTLNVASVDPEAFPPGEVELLKQISSQIAIAVENALAYQEITGMKEQLAEANLYLEDEIRLQHDFSGIIGDSPALKRVLQAVETVAPTDATVLLRGETGTGKELLARAIHNLSRRRERTFVRLSVAALPITLIESELFGYEKGAFSGAATARIGRLELANRGTLFLDEVGDIPLEVQPKLLRALQEREFERLGSTPDAAGRRAPDRGHEPRSGADGRRRIVSKRSLLPAERVSGAGAGPARPLRGYSGARPPLRREVRAPDEASHHDHPRCDDGCAPAILLARQHSRARERDRTRRHPFIRTGAAGPSGRSSTRLASRRRRIERCHRPAA